CAMRALGNWGIAAVIAIPIPCLPLFSNASDGPTSAYVIGGGEPQKLPAYKPTPQELAESYERAQKFSRSRGRVYNQKITPHWFHDNSRFWYVKELRNDEKEFILVDAEKAVRQAAFDHEKLAQALSKASGKQFQAMKLPFSSIEFGDQN